MTLTHEQVQDLTAYFEPQEHEFLRGFTYITEGAITTRLDTVDPSWTFEVLSITVRGEQVIAQGRLQVAGVWRDNVGMAKIMQSGANETGEPEKSATTDALKRCARLFGIGRYLLDLPGNVKDIASLTQWLGKPAQKPAQEPPATTKASSQANSAETPQKGDKRNFAVTQLETALTKEGKPYYRLTATDNTEILTFNRELFRAWGWADELVDSMQESGFKTEIEVEVNALATPRKDGKGLVWMAVIPEVSEIPF